MTKWEYDSYCNDNVQEYIEHYDESTIESDIQEFLTDYPSWDDLEFVLGIAMYRIRCSVKVSDNTLRILRDVIDDLLENSKFKYWIDKDKRKIKITQERRIINCLLKKVSFKFGKLIEKPLKFNDLEIYIYNSITF